MTDKALNNLVTVADPRSPLSEAYRTLRTNLDFSSLDKPLHSLLVTSAGPNEGKSTTLANLAVVTAQAGKRVILVDCDLRRPAMHRLFGTANDEGLTTMARDEATLQQPPLQATGVDDLWLLPSGPLPPDPTRLLGSRRMEEIIAALLQQADAVLFDAPPVTVVTDAAVLATKMDGVVLVFSAGTTRRDHARMAKDRLEKVNANVVGVVLNNARFDMGWQQYYAEPA